MLFWGGSYILTSILLNYFQPVTIIFIRILISAIFLFSLIFLWKKWQRIRREDLLLLFLSAVFNPFLYFIGENYGVKYCASTVSAIMIATIPVFSPLAAWLAYRERLTSLNLTGIGVSFIGILIMLFNKDFSPAADPKGILFLSGAILSALFYSVILRKLTMMYSPFQIIAMQNFIGIFLFLPVLLLFETPDPGKLTINAEVIISFLFLSVFASSLAYVFFAKTIKELGVSKANIFSNLIPVFTAIFSYFILDELISLKKILGMSLVIAGVYLSQRVAMR
jgi:drug/metabolite transporter (DMT)-like permease